MNKIMLSLLVLCTLALLACSKKSPSSSKRSLSRPKQQQGDRKEDEYSINFFERKNRKDETPEGLQEKGQLYEAYNLLHTLAQDFHKPFDAPAVVVVGHQTSGKSALIEALMGFQFNQVGGGTKTRRPVALRMQYNPNCATPLCFLTRDNGKEEQRSLSDIQAYIESENKRLERDSTRSFDPREINIRMEYRYCPNMIVIDTPGMLHPPKGKQLTAQQRALAQAAREAEALVLSKIRCQDYIILCVEDTTDWKHATTRNLVMQADPQLTRTVLVTTKLDTKLPQFSDAGDLEEFLKAPLVKSMCSQLMGGPFFTSVPSGRVGISKDFGDNEAFVAALKSAERADRAGAVQRMGAVRARTALQTVGVSRLRTFLEARVEDCYRGNVAKIVPLLQSELRHTESKLSAVDDQLKGLSLEHLRQMASEYRERFAKELSNAIQGTVKASVAEFGETLDQECLRSGSFLQQGQVQSAEWQRLLESEVGNAQHKLFGGAQYHRALREFTIAVRHMTSSAVTEDEIANAAGMGDRHNGVNFMRAACVIAMEKAQMGFEPMLEALRCRAAYVMKRLYPIVEEMVRKSSPVGSSSALGSHSAPFQQMMRGIYERFVEQQLDFCLVRCRDDLIGMTRFVTWDVEDKGGASTLYRLLPTPQKMVEIYSIAVEKRKTQEEEREMEVKEEEEEEEEEEEDGGVEGKVMQDWRAAKGKKAKKVERESEGAMQKVPAGVEGGADAELSDYFRVMQLTEEMISGTSASRTSALVTSLVEFITASWRNHFARSTSMKFNCFFLMPFMDDFPAYLRNELDAMYDSGVAELFDIAETRRALQARRAELLAECTANSRLQSRFDSIAAQLHTSHEAASDGGVDMGVSGMDMGVGMVEGMGEEEEEEEDLDELIAEFSQGPGDPQ